MAAERPILGITMGDPAGIGPEIVAKIAAEPRLRAAARLLVIGDARVMREALSLVGSAWQLRPVQSVADAHFEDAGLDLLDVPVLGEHLIRPGVAEAHCGAAAVTYVKCACKLAIEGAIHAITSAPLNKEAMYLSGFHYAGQTEILAEACGVKRCAMMLVSGNIRLLFVTNHVPLNEVSGKITQDNVYGVIRLAYDALQTPTKSPVIAVAGLNPHAGDGGALGREEIERIIPAIERAHADGMTSVVGPLPPDTIFLAARDGRYDAVISMYHDHGSTAMKLLGFQRIVTVLVGLPIIRTSVGHGTAFDIAGKAVADHTNLLEAALLAAELASARQPCRN